MRLTSAAVLPTISGLSRIVTGTLRGLDLQLIEVEVALRRGPPQFELAGLAETSVREARIRVGSALSNLGMNLDEHAVTVSLAPAHLRKGGGGLDLAISAAILEAGGLLPAGSLDGALVVGELALDGSVRAVSGLLPMLEGARTQGLRRAFIPERNLREGSQVRGVSVMGVPHLRALVGALSGQGDLKAAGAPEESVAPAQRQATLSHIRGQASAKRALLIAAAGHHHLLLVGPPGAGKSLLARALPSLLPDLDRERSLQTTAIHSIAGLVDPELGLIQTPPFRAPHHTVSEAALIGGGQVPHPGELSLAHHGVLFLDELPEFRRTALEALRAPLEEHQVCVSRARYKVTFPAKPLLVCAMNPCPCGHFGNPRIPCDCTPTVRRKYLAKISGPLLERLDLHLAIQPVPVSDWAQSGKARGTGSKAGEADLLALVASTRERQRKRAKALGLSSPLNADLDFEQLKAACQLGEQGRALLALATDTLGLSARSYVRVLRVARTIADLEGADAVTPEHLAEALQYRMVRLDEKRPDT